MQQAIQNNRQAGSRQPGLLKSSLGGSLALARELIALASLAAALVGGLLGLLLIVGAG